MLEMTDQKKLKKHTRQMMIEMAIQINHAHYTPSTTSTTATYQGSTKRTYGDLTETQPDLYKRR